MSTSSNLGLPYIEPAQAQKHVTHNEAIRALDTLVHLAVLDRDLTVPPASSSEGARYLVAPGATGAWSGAQGKIAAWQDGAWAFHLPAEGWTAWIADEDELLAYDGAAWVAIGSAGGATDHGDLTGLADDDHPQYHTDARGDARYDALGAAAAAIAAHVGASDPHPQYLTSSEGGAAYAAASHSHANASGVAAGFMAAADKTKLDGLSVNPATGGRVGVNTTADATNKLAVKSDAVLFSHDDVTPGTGDVQVKYNKSGVARTASFLFQNAFSGRAEVGLTGDDKLHVKVSADGTVWVEAMCITATGAIGYGTAAPEAPLHVVNSSPDPVIFQREANAAGGANFILRKGRGSFAAPAVVQNGDFLGAFWFRGYDGTDYASSGALFRVEVDAVPGVDSMPSRFIVGTSASGSPSPTERFRIDSAGKVGIGDAAPAERLTIAGNVAPTTDNANTCGTSSKRWSTIYAATGTINTSDARLKTDVEDCPLGLDFIRELSPKLYRWKAGGTEVAETVEIDGDGEEAIGRPGRSELAKPGRRRHAGLIAQDVKAALDAAGVDCGLWVLDDKTDPESGQSLRYDQLIAPLIKAVKELAARVEAAAR